MRRGGFLVGRKAWLPEQLRTENKAVCVFILEITPRSECSTLSLHVPVATSRSRHHRASNSLG